MALESIEREKETLRAINIEHTTQMENQKTESSFKEAIAVGGM